MIYPLFQQVNLSLAAGFGLSLVNLTPEEVIFASFSHLRMAYETGRSGAGGGDGRHRASLSNNDNRSSMAEIRIGSVQVDNQLFGSTQPVSLFAGSASSGGSSKQSPRGSVRRNADRSDLIVKVKFEKDPDYGFLVIKVINIQQLVRKKTYCIYTNCILGPFCFFLGVEMLTYLLCTLKLVSFLSNKEISRH